MQGFCFSLFSNSFHVYSPRHRNFKNSHTISNKVHANYYSCKKIKMTNFFFRVGWTGAGKTFLKPHSFHVSSQINAAQSQTNCTAIIRAKRNILLYRIAEFGRKRRVKISRIQKLSYKKPAK